jgi:hypothetical protein
MFTFDRSCSHFGSRFAGMSIEQVHAQDLLCEGPLVLPRRNAPISKQSLGAQLAVARNRAFRQQKFVNKTLKNIVALARHHNSKQLRRGDRVAVDEPHAKRLRCDSWQLSGVQRASYNCIGTGWSCLVCLLHPTSVASLPSAPSTPSASPTPSTSLTS